MRNPDCITLAGKPEKWDLEMAARMAKAEAGLGRAGHDDVLCHIQTEQFFKGRRDATIVRTMPIRFTQKASTARGRAIYSLRSTQQQIRDSRASAHTQHERRHVCRRKLHSEHAPSRVTVAEISRGCGPLCPVGERKRRSTLHGDSGAWEAVSSAGYRRHSARMPGRVATRFGLAYARRSTGQDAPLVVGLCINRIGIVRTIYGFSVRSGSNLDNREFVPGGRRLATWADALAVGIAWANVDPENREFWVWKRDLDSAAAMSQHCRVHGDHAHCPGENTLGTQRCTCSCHKVRA